MRFIKVLLLAVCFFVALVFFVQNNAGLNQALELKFELLGNGLHSAPIPMYLLILGAFLVGSVFSTLYFFVDKMRSNGQLRKCKNRVAELEKEVNTLRTLPLEEDTYASKPQNIQEAPACEEAQA
ncbi:MAG: LapA family protein [Desulfovibrio sp.]|uniref:LapA family protein n=1 Tax=Desulfovibrio sp. 7SRBS1 TaxID=3378064 RepID=UPI003B3F4241